MQYKIHKRRAQRVVHNAVKLMPLKILSQLSVCDLVGSVLPYLSDNESVGIGVLNAFSEILKKNVRQLVGNVQPPAAAALFYILCADTVPPAEKAAAIGI